MWFGHQTVHGLGSPSRTELYRWIRNDDALGRRVEGKISSHHPSDIDEEAIRLVEGGLNNSVVAFRLSISSPAVVYHRMKTAGSGEHPISKKPMPVIGAGSVIDGFDGDEAERKSPVRT